MEKYSYLAAGRFRRHSRKYPIVLCLKCAVIFKALTLHPTLLSVQKSVHPTPNMNVPNDWEGLNGTVKRKNGTEP